MSSGPIQSMLPHRVLLALLVTLGAVTAPHVLHLPPWMTPLIIVCAAWRYQAGSRGWRLPNRWVLLLLTLVTAGGVVMHYGTFLGRDAGVAMLSLMLGLKLLEMRTRRDTQVVLYLGYFLVVTQFLYSQSLLIAGWMLVTVWALTALLITVNRRTTPSGWFPHSRLAATMVAQALPLMIILFILFPRVPGPLWGMPDDDARGVTGLGDSMTMGEISQLSQSAEVAFRVEFDGPPPAPPQRYWRGPVLPAYDGRSWRQPDDRGAFRPPLEPLGGEIGYSVTLEPHNRSWIFTLDMPVQISTQVTVGSEYQVERRNPVRERIRYDARSALNYRLDPELRDVDPAPYLHVPENRHPRTRELVRDWRGRSDNDDELIERALQHFRDQPFVYTLHPPRLQDDNVDEFLFNTRRGFCEHFAGAFAAMMRIAGIPSRVVTGYQGGEINPTGNYMIVRQSDAHAWVEIWQEDAGWRRVDPTAWVAPERIELGLDGAVPESDQLPAMARRTQSWTRQLALRWDAVNAYWDRWVLAYGPGLQQRLMDSLGLGQWQRMLSALAVAMLVCTGLLALLILWRQPARRPDPAQRAWERFCRRMETTGLPRRPQEGPRDYARRVATARPDLEQDVEGITSHYIALRYGREPHESELQSLHQRVGRFRPRRA
ncbi:MAG: DUF3488 domain-containing transglutaminase family protein [Ectothiorhodospiraceae bacterium]|nr:DUF3488 domain-containing transglutaminase family protein [Ectothiorhodospiraceae bacterium]